MRMRWVMGAALLLLVTAGSALAQSFYCSTLNRSDCALYDRRDAEMPTSASFDMTSTTVIQAGFDSLEFGFDMNGSYRLDPEQAAVFQALLDEHEDLAAVDRETAQEIVNAMLGAADADLFMTLTVPREVLVVPLTVDLWFIDSVGYIDLTSIGTVTGDPTLSGVYGFDLANAATFGFGMVEDEDFSQFMAEFMAEIDADESLDLTTPLKEQLAFNEATVITREPDTPEGGAVFRTEIDLLPLLALESFRESFYTSQTTTELSRAEVDALMDALGNTLQTEGLFLSETVDPATDHTTGITMNFDMRLQSSEFAEQYAQATGDFFTFGEGIGPVNVSFEMTITRSDFEAVPEIATPKDVDMVSLFEVFALFGDGG